jgi:hypothetical protein
VDPASNASRGFAAATALNLAKVGVEGSNPFARSRFSIVRPGAIPLSWSSEVRPSSTRPAAIIRSLFVSD